MANKQLRDTEKKNSIERRMQGTFLFLKASYILWLFPVLLQVYATVSFPNDRDQGK